MHEGSMVFIIALIVMGSRNVPLGLSSLQNHWPMDVLIYGEMPSVRSRFHTCVVAVLRWWSDQYLEGDLGQYHGPLSIAAFIGKRQCSCTMDDTRSSGREAPMHLSRHGDLWNANLEPRDEIWRWLLREGNCHEAIHCNHVKHSPSVKAPVALANLIAYW
jgi:hypothetical protein